MPSAAVVDQPHLAEVARIDDAETRLVTIARAEDHAPSPNGGRRPHRPRRLVRTGAHHPRTNEASIHTPCASPSSRGPEGAQTARSGSPVRSVFPKMGLQDHQPAQAGVRPRRTVCLMPTCAASARRGAREHRRETDERRREIERANEHVEDRVRHRLVEPVAEVDEHGAVDDGRNERHDRPRVASEQRRCCRERHESEQHERRRLPRGERLDAGEQPAEQCDPAKKAERPGGDREPRLHARERSGRGGQRLRGPPRGRSGPSAEPRLPRYPGRPLRFQTLPAPNPLSWRRPSSRRPRRACTRPSTPAARTRSTARPPGSRR